MRRCLAARQVCGGQLQRAMIAMALCSAPDLIVFDEPTTTLDVITQLGILKAIAGVIREAGVAASPSATIWRWSPSWLTTFWCWAMGGRWNTARPGRFCSHPLMTTPSA
ncbi:ATP-binding cassette domain-containing protein [Pseudomonas huanghezhanensis]|uniref:ATP-binding cassette domain-containing protein n=1 Tax=Pseudomonas huanghezhanensis TaxID=3002903 RepID=UPI002285F3AC|nr:ATP-binding cassette domain-containing protein [Pseudomonas sp. BSw22131]